MEKNLLDTLINKTLQYLAEFKETQSYVIGAFDHISEEIELPVAIKKECVIEESPRQLPTPKESHSLKQVSLEQDSIKQALLNQACSKQEPTEPTVTEIFPKEQKNTSSHQPSPIASFPLHPPTPIHKDPMQDIQAVLKKVAPSLIISNSIPSDEKAKKIKNAWKEHAKIPDITILATQSPSLSFLTQVAKAIEIHFFPSKVIDVKELEQNNNWDVFLNTTNLKMIIAPDSVIWSCKHLMRYYHEFPNKKERYLGKIPLLLLPDPSLYIKDPSLKRSLWNLLCQVLKPLQR